MYRWIGSAGVLFCLLCCAPLQATADDGAFNQAVRAAVDRVESGVVRIQGVGGDGNRTSVSQAPTTGVVISEDGYILTSAFALQGNPAGLLVTDAAGKPHPATIVATDYVRRIVLLKAEGRAWRPMAAARASSVQVGQWAIAVGRFHSAAGPSVSVGIISALQRISGLAIQTDALISPVNYGGPLVDIRGRWVGLLVPLSPDANAGLDGGVEWYDSGIGFAIPAEEALAAAKRLRNGQDLRRGRLGVRLTEKNPLATELKIDAVAPGSSAAAAGLQAEDLIVAVNGEAVGRLLQFESQLRRRYAGDQMVLAVERNGERLELDVVLGSEGAAAVQSYLGLLPQSTLRRKPRSPQEAGVDDVMQRLRDRLNGLEEEAAEDSAEEEGAGQPPPAALVCRIIPKSPASQAGLPEEVELLSVQHGGVDWDSPTTALMRNWPPGSEVVLRWRAVGSQDDATETIVQSSVLPTSAEELPLNDIPRAAEATYQSTRMPLSDEAALWLITPSSDGTAPLPARVVIAMPRPGSTLEKEIERWGVAVQGTEIVVAIPDIPEGTPDTFRGALTLVARTLESLRLSAVLVPGADQADEALNLGMQSDGPVRGVVYEKQQPGLKALLLAAESADSAGSPAALFFLNGAGTGRGDEAQRAAVAEVRNSGISVWNSIASDPDIDSVRIVNWCRLLHAW